MEVMTEPTLLAATGLAKSFPSGWRRRPVHALSGVDLVVQPGEVVALLGPNGSGKTTLLHALLGVVKPDRGRATLLGRPPRDPRALAQVGFVPEKDPPWGRLTGQEVVRFAGGLHGLSKGEARRLGGILLERLGLAEAAHRSVQGYSKGMGRRLALAAALVHTPRLLILDEPTAGLDPIGSGLVLEMLAAHRGPDRGILLSSHLFHEVEALADRVVILFDGRILAQGPTEEILADPGAWRIEVEGISPAGIAALEELARRQGRLKRSGPALRGLERVLRETIQEDRR